MTTSGRFRRVGRPCATGCDPEDGSGSVLGLAVVGVVCSVLVALLMLVGAVAASHRAQAAADLAALAAAASVSGEEGSACVEARRVAAAQGAAVPRCTVDGGFVEVEAVVVPSWPVSRFGAARARARAGPEEGPARGREWSDEVRNGGRNAP